MKFRRHPSQTELRARYDYRSDGVFISKVANRGWPAGRVIEGAITSTGHRIVSFQFGFKENTRLLLHRLIWIWHHGDIPDQMLIDHINGNRSDNRIENLRLATHSQNHMNDESRKGYSWVKAKKKWRAEITTGGFTKYLGYFDSEEDARSAYVKAKIDLHGDFTPEIIRNG